MKTSQEWARIAMERLRQGGQLSAGQQANILAMVINAAVLEAEPRWIPITEGLPEPYTAVLIAVPGEGVYYAQRCSKGIGGPLIWSDIPQKYWSLHPSHWMPIPTAPNSEGQQ